MDFTALQGDRHDSPEHPAVVVDQLWRPLAEHEGGHRLTLLPDVSRRAGRLPGPLRGLLVDG